MGTETEGGRAPWAAVEARQRRRAARDRMWRRDLYVVGILCAAGVVVLVVHELLGRGAPGWAWAWAVAGGVTALGVWFARRAMAGLDDATFDRVDETFCGLARWLPGGPR